MLLFRAQAHPAIRQAPTKKMCLRESSRLVRAAHCFRPGHSAKYQDRRFGCLWLWIETPPLPSTRPRPNCRLLPVRHSHPPEAASQGSADFRAYALPGFQRSAFIDKIRADGGLSRRQWLVNSGQWSVFRFLKSVFRDKPSVFSRPLTADLIQAGRRRLFYSLFPVPCL